MRKRQLLHVNDAKKEKKFRLEDIVYLSIFKEVSVRCLKPVERRESRFDITVEDLLAKKRRTFFGRVPGSRAMPHFSRHFMSHQNTVPIFVQLMGLFNFSR